MTTIDPHDFSQPSLSIFENFREPRVQVWDNVTFADNYYQTVADPNGLTLTPNGRSMSGQVNVSLNGLPGFTKDDGVGGPHGAALAWYAGTVDLDLNQLKTDGRIINPLDPGSRNVPHPEWVYDRRGEQDLQRDLGEKNAFERALDKLTGNEDHPTNIQSWYTSNGSNEGTGIGWYYSVLGGGKRPNVEVQKTAVSYDNTYDRRMRGDFAVPTLFDGNFDAVTTPYASFNNPIGGAARSFISKEIPGWSFHNSANSTLTDPASHLVEWRDISALTTRWEGSDKPNYLEKLGLDPTSSNYQENYAFKLSNGEKITHNRFIVPDWGALRFDLHTGDVQKGISRGQLKVFLDEVGTAASTTPLQIIELQEAEGTAAEYAADRWRIGYGETGFETFTINVDNSWRGKSATLRFELTGGEVYLDNVFFKSQHLLLGNPTEARSSQSETSNYLIEKPQYAVSYNDQTKNPNWVSWRIDKSWIGDSTNSVSRRSLRLTNLPPDYPPNTDYSAQSGDEPWMSDPELPATTFPVKVEGADLNNAISSGALQRGHLTAFRDRDRNAKDAIATFLTTNLIPQNAQNNVNNTAWANFEGYLENTLVSQGREVYVIAGGYYEPNRTRLVANNTIVDQNGNFVLDSNNRIKTGTSGDLEAGESLRPRTNPKQISVPDFTWKIAVVLNPGQQLSDISASTQVIAIITPNRDTPPNSSDSIQLPNQPLPIAVNKWSFWPYWRVDVNYLEEITNYDFFSNLPDEIEQAIESDNSSPLIPPLQAAPLLAESELIPLSDPSISFGVGIGDNSSIRQDSVIHVSTESGSLFPSTLEVGPNHGSFPSVAVTQISPTEISAIQNGQHEVGSFQISISQNGLSQSGMIQNSSAKISPLEIDFIKTDFFQFNSTQINPTEISLPSGVTLQQFFSSHNFSLQNITVPIWTEFLQGQAPFNLNFAIADLPSGQLAEASITGYDASGRPNAGTLTLDLDGNGLGWFIDSTPWDNSEFTQSLTYSAFKATIGSAAFGRYDLLTTILHEAGHLAGIIQGNPAFDRHIQTISAERNSAGTAGSKLFIDDGFTAKLTSDGSHLDSTAYPYDLMNTTLTPGVRKLPSILDLQILNAIRQGSSAIALSGLSAPLRSHSSEILGPKFEEHREH